MGCFQPILEKVGSLKWLEVVTVGLCAQDGVKDENEWGTKFRLFAYARPPEKRVLRGIIELYAGFLELFGAMENGRDQRVCAPNRKVVCSIIGQTKKLRQL